MKKRVKKIRTYAWVMLFCLLAGVLTVPAGTAVNLTVHAASVSEDEDTAESLEQDLKEAEDAVNEASDAASDAQENVDSLEAQAAEVAAQIENTQNSIVETSADVDTLQEELADAGVLEDEQKQAMKLRIKYLYEEGTDNIWVILLTAQNFSEFLNRFEYAASVTKYDSDMIAQYQELQDTIAEKTASLNAKQLELTDSQSTLESQKSQLSSILAAAGEDLQTKYAALSEAEESLTQIQTKIDEFQSALAAQEAADAANKAAQAQALAAQIEAEAAAEEAAKKQAEAEAAEAAAKLQAAKDAEAAAQAAKDAAQKALEDAKEAAANDPTNEDAAKAVEDAQNNLDQAESTLAATKESTAAAQAAADAAAAKISDYRTTNSYGQVGTVYYVTNMSYSTTDLDELTTIIYCEAGNQTYNVQLAVASVILNRVRSSWFSQNTIHGVIFASGQFEPTWLKTSASGNKTFFEYIYDQRSTLLSSSSAYRTARQAALDALSGKRITNLCFFWSASSNSRPSGSIVYGDLVFFGRVVQLY